MQVLLLENLQQALSAALAEVALSSGQLLQATHAAKGQEAAAAVRRTGSRVLAVFKPPLPPGPAAEVRLAVSGLRVFEV